MSTRMQKRVNPNKLVDCPGCCRTGVAPGVYEGKVCDPCDGNGVFDKETGDTVDKELWVIELLKILKKQDLKIAWYQQKLEVQEKGHFEDLKPLNGGRFRND